MGTLFRNSINHWNKKRNEYVMHLNGMPHPVIKREKSNYLFNWNKSIIEWKEYQYKKNILQVTLQEWTIVETKKKYGEKYYKH